MRITKLTLHDFLNHAHSELELGGLTLITGGNNAGKSAIKDALQFLLTGTARTTDKRGAGAEDLKRVGGIAMEVLGEIEVGKRALQVARQAGSLEVNSEGVTWGGKMAEKQDQLHKLLGADGRVIKACLHAGSLPELPPKEQEALLFDLMALEFEASTIMELLHKGGCHKADAKLLWHPDLEELRGAGEAKLESGAYGHEVFQFLYQEAYDARKDWRKRAKELRATATREQDAETAVSTATPALMAIIKDVPLKVVELETQLATLRARRDELLTRVAKAKERQSTLSVSTVKAALAEELEEFKTVVAWQAKRQELIGTQDLGKVLAALREGVREGDAKVSLTTARARALRDTAAKFRGKATCPLMGDACPLEGVRLGYVVTVLETRAESGEQTAGHERVELEGLNGKLAAVQELHDTRGRTQAQVQEAVDRSEKLLMDLEIVELEDMPALEQELTELTRRVEAGPARIQVVKDWGAQLERTTDSLAKAAAAEKSLASWERLCKALGPKGIRARAIAGPLKELEAKINARLNEYSPGHRVELTSTEGFELRVYGPGNADCPLPIKGLSTSERLRVGVALQDALSHLTGLRFLLIDNMDMLDADNEWRLFATLEGMAADYDSIVVIATMDSDHPLPNPGQGWTVYWLKDGAVESEYNKSDKVAHAHKGEQHESPLG